MKLPVLILFFSYCIFADLGSELFEDDVQPEAVVEEQQCSEEGLGPFEKMFNAAAQGQLETVQEVYNSDELQDLMKQEGSSIDKRISKGQTTTFAACVSGKMDTIKYMVEKLGADMLVKDDNGYDCFYVAAVRGDVKLFKYMLKRGYDPENEYDDGETAFHVACRHPSEGSLQIVGMSLKKGVYIDEFKRHDETCLMRASGFLNLPVVEYLIKKKANVDEANEDGRSALHYVLHQAKLFKQKDELSANYDTLEKILFTLIRNGADIWLFDNYRQSPVMHETWQDFIEPKPTNKMSSAEYKDEVTKWIKSKMPRIRKKRKTKVKKKKQPEPKYEL